MATEKLARDFLVGEGYMPVDMWDDKGSLAHVLLLLAHCALASVLHKGVQAVTTLLEHKVASKSAETLAAAVMGRVNPLTNLIEQSAEAIQDAATDTKKVTTVMYSMWEEVRDEMQKVTDTTKEELIRVVEETRDEIHKEIRGSKDTLTGCNQWADNNAVDDHATFRMPTSYAAALNTKLPSMHSSMLARTWVRERQVLIDKDPQADLNQLDTLNELELVAKENKAILGMLGQLCLELGKEKLLEQDNCRMGV